MNIAIIGATGMVGARAVAEAASRGHQVDAYSRSGKSVEGATNALAVDMTDSAALAEIVNNHDATIIAVSAGRGTSAQPIIDAHKGLIAAAPTGRLLVVAGAGSLENEEGVRFVNLPGFPEDYKPEALAFSEILDAYRASEGLSWTALSPAFDIEPGERTGSYSVALDNPAGEYVSAEDFAVALLDELEDPKHAGRRFTVATR